MSIPTFIVESSRATTNLCIVGATCRTDKSPFNPIGHRHPYTAFYSMILAPYKNKATRFVEIGVAGGASVVMWSHFFSSSAELIFFDRDDNFLTNSSNMRIPNTKFYNMDVDNSQSIREGFEKAGGNFDIILDDSSHNVDHQRKIVGEVLPFLKPGGIFLIEDVFRNIDNSVYMDIIKPYLSELAFYGFFEMEHTNKNSFGWDNDKILMLVKN
jgi:predicted O-methyltransferase YrrM